jgi:hypothetical protein
MSYRNFKDVFSNKTTMKARKKQTTISTGVHVGQYLGGFMFFSPWFSSSVTPKKVNRPLEDPSRRYLATTTPLPRCLAGDLPNLNRSEAAMVGRNRVFGVF